MVPVWVAGVQPLVAFTVYENVLVPVTSVPVGVPEIFLFVASKATPAGKEPLLIVRLV